jgi:hypothetical protein
MEDKKETEAQTIDDSQKEEAISSEAVSRMQKRTADILGFNNQLS